MEKKVKRLAVFAVVLLIVGVMFYYVIPVCAPLLAAFVTALAMEPGVRWGMRKLSLKRNASVLIQFSLFVGCFCALGYAIFSKGVTQAIHIAERIPQYTLSFVKRWERWTDSIMAASEELPLALVNEIGKQLDSMLYSVTDPLKTFNYLKFVTSIGTWVPLFVLGVVVYLIATVLFMFELPQLKQWFYSHLKEESAQKFRFIQSRLSAVASGFLKAQFLVSVIVFVVSLIGLLLITPKVAVIMALFLWLIDFLPIVGTIVLLGPWALLEFVQGNAATGIGLCVLALVLLIIRRALEPKLMGQYLGLSPLMTLISMFIGVQLLGVSGLLLGPLTLILFRTAKEAGLIRTDFKI